MNTAPASTLSTYTHNTVQMPHAEENVFAPLEPSVDMDKADTPMTNGTAPMTNGEQHSSKVLSHLQSYPVINDTVSVFQSHPYGAKSLSLFNEIYNRVQARIITPLSPYLQTPYSYVSPYVSRADELGDANLTKIESRFPIVKEDTEKLKETVTSYVSLPLTLAGQGKEYVIGTFNDEYSKTSGNGGVLKLAIAGVSTQLKIGHDGLDFVKGYFQNRKQNGGKKMQ
ncbi:hypothetical protein GQ43DRAFT_439105 [Delitschia confertaspora ATCC 74209]|uniref:CAP20-virulence factor n=1 Tax=Delitschia confertaspora ATCC 74209 TaxID=1513339 RepID=A0A9P4JQ23_9PLEO|nr:hypothetical protein GQ43DRAFT_439105 [Delitschia confertaspora ATCC 74209]